MMPYQQVFTVCLILAGFNSHLTWVASTNADSSSIAQVSRVCPEDQQKWTPSGLAAITATDQATTSNTLQECKETCKDTNGCVAVKYSQHTKKCAILWKPNEYVNVEIADNVKIDEAVLHVLNCEGKFVDMLLGLSSLSNGYFTVCLFRWYSICA
ncbi:hypothetical protein EG68_06820 [Paragonimus skrjabini miyazakii]|uniref:Apple domain-containing protein n=1 Tax=Paragonimus skrjabini miyazakii TaxID=59628 RepID=A0A8S9YYA6_9TREM|nr:hypothetical protein EG68_06820 [Paragonimus skrjabini miyazakii]